MFLPCSLQKQVLQLFHSLFWRENKFGELSRFGVCYSGGQHSAACGRNAVGGDTARLRTPWNAATTEAAGVGRIMAS